MRSCIGKFIWVCEGQSRCEGGERKVIQVYVRQIMPARMGRVLIICYIHDRNQLSCKGGLVEINLWDVVGKMMIRQLACDCCWLNYFARGFLFFEKVQKNDAASRQL